MNTIKLLKLYRVANRIRLKEVAEKMRTTESGIARLESGRHSPKESTLQAYASALGLKIETILRDVNNKRVRMLDEKN